VKIIDFIIAEDIRFESGNKFSVMGIFSNDIRLSLPDNVQWPFPYRFGIFVRVQIEGSDELPTRFVMNINHGGEHVAKMDGVIESSDKKSVGILTLPLVMSPFPLPGFGTMLFNMDIFHNERLLLSGQHSIGILPVLSK
jgi:hypothetical protein